MASSTLAHAPPLSRRTAGLDIRRRLLVATLVLAGLAMLINRQNLPASLLVEHYYFGHPEWDKFVERPAYRFQESPILLVSDSMLLAAPWRTDMLVAPARTSEKISYLFQENIGDRHYACAVVWTGTFEWMLGNRPSDAVDAMAALVSVVREHADRVVVIGVMPHLQADGVYDPSVRKSAEITELIRKRCPHIDVVDVLPIHTRALRENRRSEWYADGVHLSTEGFRLLAELLAAHDVHVEEDPVLVEGVRQRMERFRRDWEALEAFEAGRR